MHNLIVGNSTTGKSNLAKYFAKMAEINGEQVIVYDPLKSQNWPKTAEKFASPELFLSAIPSIQSAHVFIDEAKTLWDYDYKRADTILYHRRHQGLLSYVIAQRTRMVPPNARNQCSRIYAFKQQKQDAEILAGEYDEMLLMTTKLKPGEFIVSDGFVSKKYKLDYSNGIPPLPVSINEKMPDSG